ncbi:uncharacterized protein IL334_005057 [Kwoniella shivajii]|uniref:SH3 domain-containing protein n=1 Tax=Kwoniella shivajii TaxID=564305 RepID=A0ABZ1D614_9TREE|nr:hypothetical protein IL334_005057 [Kwoniella shivajii]
MSNSHLAVTAQNSSVSLKNDFNITAYHASISQHYHSLLQSFPTPKIRLDQSDLEASSSSLHSKYHSTGKALPPKDSLLDPNMEIQVLIEDCKSAPIETKPTENVSDTSSSRCGSSSIATQHTRTNTINSKGSDIIPRGRSRLNKIISGDRYDFEKSEDYDSKRAAKLAKHRVELEDKVGSWWIGVREAIISNSILEVSSDIPDHVPSPSLPYAVIQRSTRSPKPPADVPLPTLTFFGDFPKKVDQFQLSSPTPSPPMERIISPESCTISPYSLPSAAYAVNIVDKEQPLSFSSSSPFQNQLSFSTKACRATLKSCGKVGLGIGRGSPPDGESSENEWLLNVLDDSKDWDIPFQAEKEILAKQINQRGPQNPIKIIVSGEMPTPKPMIAGTTLWG